MKVLDLFTRAEEHFADALKVVPHPMMTRRYSPTRGQFSFFKQNDDKAVLYNQGVYYYERAMCTAKSPMASQARVYLRKSRKVFKWLLERDPTEGDVLCNLIISTTQLAASQPIDYRDSQKLLVQAGTLVEKLKELHHPRAEEIAYKVIEERIFVEEDQQQHGRKQDWLNMDTHVARSSSAKKASAAACILF